MYNLYAWGNDLITPNPDDKGLEAFEPSLIQGSPQQNQNVNYFKPANIVSDKGIYYGSFYVCHIPDGSTLSQQLTIWLSQLKETDVLRLSVMSLLQDVNLPSLISLMSALQTTKARTEMVLDHIVIDALSYFYLLSNKIIKKSEGALFIPSYIDQRQEDISSTKKAILDFFSWIVDEAVMKQFLTKQEAETLHKGSHIIVTDDRFTV